MRTRFLLATIILVASTSFAMEPAMYIRQTSGFETLWGKYFSSPVYTENFEGTAARLIVDDAKLRITLRQTSGIFDTAIRYYYKAPAAENVHSLYYIHAKWLVTVAGNQDSWWVGPKLSVNYTPSLNDWYECYIVEKGTRSWQEWRDVLKGFNSYNYLGRTYWDGSYYDHYRVDFGWWKQFYSIRRRQRSGGVISIASFLHYWRAIGNMPNLPVDEIRLNLEAIGRNDLDVDIKPFYVPDDYTSEPAKRPDTIGD